MLMMKNLILKFHLNALRRILDPPIKGGIKNIGDYLKLDREKGGCPLFTLNNFLNFLWGSLRGRSPQAELWASKAEGLIIGWVG